MATYSRRRKFPSLVDKEKHLAGDTVTNNEIFEKAKKCTLYTDLISFKASREWFDNFKKRSGIHSVVRHRQMYKYFWVENELSMFQLFVMGKFAPIYK